MKEDKIKKIKVIKSRMREIIRQPVVNASSAAKRLASNATINSSSSRSAGHKGNVTELKQVENWGV